jgi:hypothetical protein
MYRGLIGRQKNTLLRLEAQLKGGMKATNVVNDKGISFKEFVELTLDDKERISKEIKLLQSRLNGEKKATKKKVAAGENGKQDDKWLIDIYSVNYGYVKNSERRKNKGKSKKKMKKVKTTSLLRTVVAQSGMINSYKEGRMGLSPKTHVFKLRRDAPIYL